MDVLIVFKEGEYSRENNLIVIFMAIFRLVSFYLKLK